MSEIGVIRLESEVFPVAKVHTFGTIVNGGTPTSGEENWNGDIPFITPPDLNGLDGKEVTSVGRTITETGLESGSNLVKNGVIISGRAPVGYVGLVTTPSAFNQGCKAICTAQNHRYVAYALATSKSNLQVLANGTTFSEISSTSVANYAIPLPPLETQQRIADYLDRETAEIDAAVADLDRYVELLEKRKRAVGAALLDEAVKDESTLTVHLGSLGTFLSGSGFPHDYQGIEDEEYPFYKVGSLSTADRNAVVHDSRNTVSRKTALELGAKVIPNGSVLMAKIGEAMRLCRFAVNATDCCIDNNMMAVVPQFEHITTDYLRLALTLVTVDVLVNPGPVPSLNVQGLRMFSIPLPSLEIQEKLTGEWKKETSEIDSLIAESTKLRDLLLKRRSVLITEVVTGRKQV